MALSSTTQQVVENNSSLIAYETIEFKRRFATGFDSEWTDQTSKLLGTSSSKISKKLDFDSFGYGQFKSGVATFLMDNSQGTFNNESEIYSFFAGTISRHYSKVRFSAGYFDEDGAKIDEVVFEGLLNGKTITRSFEKGEIKLSVIGYETILSERTTEVGTITGTTSATIIEDIFDADTFMASFVTFSLGNINPGTDITFDDGSAFEGKTVTAVLNDICKKTDSVWYIDTTQNLILRNRAVTVASSFAFIGGFSGKRTSNIVKIDLLDDGFTKIINEVKYSSSTGDVINRAIQDNIDRYGISQLNISGDDITTLATKTVVANAILEENQRPKTRLILTTVYMPNVLDLFDPCSVEYLPDTIFNQSPKLVFNDGIGNWNDGYFFGKYRNQNILLAGDNYKYFGFEHDIKKGLTKHFLLQV